MLGFTMHLSKHARARSQQRAISKSALELVSRYGTLVKKPGGATEMFIKNRVVGDLICQKKSEIHDLERARNIAVLVSDDEPDLIITAYHKI